MTAADIAEKSVACEIIALGLASVALLIFPLLESRMALTRELESLMAASGVAWAAAVAENTHKPDTAKTAILILFENDFFMFGPLHVLVDVSKDKGKLGKGKVRLQLLPELDRLEFVKRFVAVDHCP